MRQLQLPPPPPPKKQAPAPDKEAGVLVCDIGEDSREEFIIR
jgi:hypothetical protein